MSIHSYKKLLVIGLLFGAYQSMVPLTSLLKSDPYPVFSSLDPHTFLYQKEKQLIKGFDIEPARPEYFALILSPFGVNADIAKDIRGRDIALGNINGKWSMIAALYGDMPKGKSLGPTLLAAQADLFPGGIGLNDPNYIDPAEKFGFFAFPSTFRKRGVRFEFDANFPADFGMCIQTGVVDICQTVTIRENGTPDSGTFPSYLACVTQLDACKVQRDLMNKLKEIALEQCLSLKHYHSISIEEVRFNLYWRHAFEINKNEEEWPEFLLIPFFQASGSISPGKHISAHKAFDPGFNNNGYNSAGFNTGLNFDFYDTIEIGVEFGYTHFFKRNCVEMRVPNSIYQQGFFPFSTAVNSQPGDNWNFGAKMSAYHFLDKLSFYFQYMLVHHEKDSIKLVECDPAFKPEILEKLSDWKCQVANVGFNYDISPNIILGFFWQAPLQQRRTYKDTTIMFTIWGAY